jgi:hypothetical protein
MSHRNATDVALIILAVIGALALIAVLSMWLMHVTMMSWMMGGGGWFGGFFLWLLIIAGVVAAVVLLLRGKPHL